MQYPVIIVDYDPEWPHLFEAEKDLINDCLGDAILSVEHVGSTAVPGLAAKPIIDIMIGVSQLDVGRALCLKPLQELGYNYVPEFEQTMPDRYFLFRGTTEAHSHHIHIAEPDSTFWIDHILFRDYLRKYRDAADAYADLKRNLAEKFRMEREAYGIAKTDFIEDVLTKARQEFKR